MVKTREEVLDSMAKYVLPAVSLLALSLAAAPALAQWSSEAEMLDEHPDLPWYSPYESDSAGRGWAYPDANQYELVGAGGPGAADIMAAPTYETPEGIEPLERDLYTSDDFYIDRELWSDPRYFRCNSGLANESLWGAYPGGALIVDNDAASAPWGYCDRDYPRVGILSPYAFETAQEHYEALLAEAEANGGPSEYDWENPPPNWNGRYRRDDYENWWWQRINQIPTILSLLTDEYQTRTVQEAYHQGHTNTAQWPSQYCWPEGMMRRWHQYSVQGNHELMVTPTLVQWLMGTADNFLLHYHIGREFNFDGNVPRLGEDVPRWYGESVAFWDEDALITWTSNIQGWVTHNAFEHSNELQIIEIFTPNYDEAGEFTGLHHEAIFYDAEALLQPVRQIQWYDRVSDFDEGNPYVFIECNQTIFPIDGRAQPVSPGQVIEYRVPDRFGRPWAHTWELYHEEGMQRPEAEGLFGF